MLSNRKLVSVSRKSFYLETKSMFVIELSCPAKKNVSLKEAKKS